MPCAVEVWCLLSRRPTVLDIMCPFEKAVPVPEESDGASLAFPFVRLKSVH